MARRGWSDPVIFGGLFFFTSFFPWSVVVDMRKCPVRGTRWAGSTVVPPAIDTPSHVRRDLARRANDRAPRRPQVFLSAAPPHPSTFLPHPILSTPSSGHSSVLV